MKLMGYSQADHLEYENHAQWILHEPGCEIVAGDIVNRLQLNTTQTQNTARTLSIEAIRDGNLVASEDGAVAKTGDLLITARVLDKLFDQLPKLFEAIGNSFIECGRVPWATLMKPASNIAQPEIADCSPEQGLSDFW